MTANSNSDYLTKLRVALDGSDAAIIQDALSDAEEHLRMALENMHMDQPETSKSKALQAIIIEYGTPEEITEAYREVEAYTRHIWVSSVPKKKRNIFSRF